MTTTAPLATVTPLRTPTLPGFLPFRWSEPRAEYTHPTHRTMAIIEGQAALAFEAADGDAAGAFELLATAGCRFTAEQVERLFTLSTEAAELQSVGSPVDFHIAADLYADYLAHLAVESRTAVQA